MASVAMHGSHLARPRPKKATHDGLVLYSRSCNRPSKVRTRFPAFSAIRPNRRNFARCEHETSFLIFSCKSLSDCHSESVNSTLRIRKPFSCDRCASAASFHIMLALRLKHKVIPRKTDRATRKKNLNALNFNSKPAKSSSAVFLTILFFPNLAPSILAIIKKTVSGSLTSHPVQNIT